MRFLIFIIFLSILGCKNTNSKNVNAAHNCTPSNSRFTIDGENNFIKNTSISYTGKVLIPGGTFSMGADDNQGWRDEFPKHDVMIDSFWMDIHEVTNAQF